MISSITGRIKTVVDGPVIGEADVFDAIERVFASKPALLVLDVLHGASARAIVLAAVKSKVPAAIWCRDFHSMTLILNSNEGFKQKNSRERRWYNRNA